MGSSARPFTAATNKFAYAQAFTRTSPSVHRRLLPLRRHRGLPSMHMGWTHARPGGRI